MPTITEALIPVDTPIKLAANIIYALPSAGNQLSFQSVTGSDLLLSIDGVNFASSGTASLANEVKTIFTSAAFCKCATANTYVISKVAPISTLSPPTGGGGGGTGASLHADGTLALPGISYTNEPDLGLWRSSTNKISVVNNSITEMIIDGVQHFIFVNALSSQNFVQIGAIPALTGAIRLVNNAVIAARNAANTADINLLQLDATNTILLGQAGTPVNIFGNTVFNGEVTFGVNTFLTAHERVAPPAPPADTAYLWLQDDGASHSQLMIRFFTGLPIAIATEGQDYITVGAIPSLTGSIRLSNPGSIKVRNAANTADLNLITATGDTIQLGDTNAPITILSTTNFSNPVTFNNTTTFNNSTTFTQVVNFTQTVNFSQPIAFTGDYLAIGTNPAQTGVLRVRNGATFNWRNAANTGDLQILWADSSNQVALNWAQPYVLYLGGSVVNIGATAGAVNINPYLTIDGGVPAASGAIRLAVNQAIKARQLDQLGDVNMINYDGGSVVIGQPSLQTFVYGWLGLEEAAPQGVPPGNRVFLYLQDTGAGKTQLMVRFASGAAVAIAQES